MRVSESWLREWVEPELDAAQLAEALTLAGLECGAPEPVGGEFSDVVVGEVTALRAHPDADKLRIAEVDAGQAEPLTIVCGAPNVRVGMKAPVALVGAKLPGGVKIRAAKLRGQPSAGMLCSARELSLSVDAAGLMELPADAPVGEALEVYLQLDDQVLELELTPNRGDCLGMRGVAREVGAITGAPVSEPAFQDAPVTGDNIFPIDIRDFDGCPRYAGRVIRGIDPGATTPVWLTERLRRAGVRPIHPVVDVTNYIMLELGQPMHGFDLANLDGGIVVRRADKGEKLVLLDGREVTLEPDVLVIADHAGPKAMAGIMGGEHSGVQADTRDVFFESAFFTPSAVAGRARRYGLHTDASHRYERGVDPELPRLALERATNLLLEIAGGQAGPVTVTECVEALPRHAPVTLRKSQLERVLATTVPDEEATGILERLGFSPQKTADGWTGTAPSARFDIEGEHDLVEEVGRIVGFDRVPVEPLPAAVALQPVSETRVGDGRIRAAMVDRGYQEVVTYSFIEPTLETDLGLGGGVAVLSNPLSSDMSQLRRSLWPGLLQALRYNVNHQRDRVRLFEIGIKFFLQDNDIKEEKTLSGIVVGNRWPEQWDADSVPADFHDVRADLEAVLGLGGQGGAFGFEADVHPALHPGRSARIRSNGADAGWLGELHPALADKLGLEQAPLLFELDYPSISAAKPPKYREFSRFPSVRRDLAVVVDDAVSAGAVEQAIAAEAGKMLRDLRIFDIYRGRGVDSGRKSIALGLILQETSRTLTDNDLEMVMGRILSRLQRDFDATLRD
ncbi:MAG TPA: phenylalanine--tRNA ligase subunit beta [Gammaproteobacteria bacterium]|nr:phenylalanine--tRNA ligase subunit beta [Gammaproteobacteria bacterium]